MPSLQGIGFKVGPCIAALWWLMPNGSSLSHHRIRIRIHELPTAAGAENPCGLDAFAAAARDDFARLLTENGTTLLRLMLHVSKKEQGERLQDRLDEPKSRARG